MNEQELQLFLEKNKKLIYSGNAKTVFRKVYNKTKEIDWKILYDFLGEVLIEKPALQEGKKHFKFLKGYNTFMAPIKIGQIIDHRIPPRQLLKMEKYFLEKYCIFEGEEILCSFLGTVLYKSVPFLDRIFITNYRIIVLSHVFKPSSGVFIPWAGLIFNMFIAIENRMIKAKKASIIKSVEGFMDKPFFGYQFPIYQLTSITLPVSKKGLSGKVSSTNFPKEKDKVNSVKFTASTETDSFDLSIFINHKKLIFVAEKEYEDGQKMLHKIAETLQNLQEQL